jgi:hypothetical protein
MEEAKKIFEKHWLKATGKPLDEATLNHMSYCIDAINEALLSRKWVLASERLPEIDESEGFRFTGKISKDVLCYSKEWGMRFGRYFHLSGFWMINGVTSSDGVVVEYWTDIEKPS